MNTSLKIVGVFYALSALNMLLVDTTQTILSWDLFRNFPPRDLISKMSEIEITFAAIALTRVVLFAISLTVIFKSEWIVNKIVKGGYDLEGLSPDIPSISIFDTAIKIFGFFSILSAIPYVSDVLSKYCIMKNKVELLDSHSKIALTSSGLSAILYLCTGLLLVFYSTILAEKLTRRHGLESDITDVDEA